MLPLRYLVEDYDLARKGMRLWPHDAQGQDEWLAKFRISSNAIYPFRCDGETFLLRIAPEKEKSLRSIKAELAFVAYLRGQGFAALAFLPSRQGRMIEPVLHEGERYFCTVSRQVPGARMDRGAPTEDALIAYGHTLGRLHALSAAYKPALPRWDYRDALRWSTGVIARCGGVQGAGQEATRIEGALDALPKSACAYGTIHYDYELDNVFYDARTGICHVIDFDDCMLHFFGQDVVIAEDNLREELGEDATGWAVLAFRKGYLQAREPDGPAASLPVFSRFEGLYGYARTLHAVWDMPEERPDWMVDLHARLMEGLAERAAVFGTPL